MGRPPLPLGTFGKVLFIERPNAQIEARAKFRDYDGRVRLICKFAPSRAAAERALKSELAVRQTPARGGAISASTTVSALADAWLQAPHDWSSGTERTYRSVIQNHVRPALGQLRVKEVSPGVISRALTAMAARGGASAAKTSRACLSGMFGMAVEDGVLASNPVRDSVARISVAKKTPRALTAAETDELTAWLHAHVEANELDLPDVVDWMLATGCRIGEALALRTGPNRDGKPLVDLDAATWEVNATVVRVHGRGLVVQPRPKSAAGWRVVAVPSYAIRMVSRRVSARPATEPLVFTSPRASTLRDPSNVSGDLRRLLDSFDCDVCQRTGYQLDATGQFVKASNGWRVRCDEGPWSWVTSHTFRKTVATRLDEAGFSPRQVADQLGHANPSMTLDTYFGRQVVSAEAAHVLDR